MYIYIYIYIYTVVHMYVDVCIYNVYVCVYIYIYICIYTQAGAVTLSLRDSVTNYKLNRTDLVHWRHTSVKVNSTAYAMKCTCTCMFVHIIH